MYHPLHLHTDSLPFDQIRNIHEGNSSSLALRTQSLVSVTKELLKAEAILITEAIRLVDSGKLQMEWEALIPERKREIALEGLYRGACLGHSENARFDCPEMTVKGLTGDGEHSFINLLKSLIVHDPTANDSIRELFLFPNRDVDRLLRLSDSAAEAAQSDRHEALLFRTSYIVYTLNGMIDAHLGRPMEKNILVQSRSRCKHSAATEAGPKQYGCFYCQTRTSKKCTLKQCGRCKTVWYCSRECQAKDWKDHKKTCGKTDFDPSRLNPDNNPTAGRGRFIGCPTPLPSFRYSSELYQQVHYLSEAGSYQQDYHFDRGYHGEIHKTRSTRIGHVKRRMVFLVARRRALISGSPAAVHRMFEIIKEQDTYCTLDIPMENIMKQLEREYTMSFKSPISQPFNSPTAAELSEEWQFLVERFVISKLDIKDAGPIPWPRPDFENDPAWQSLG
ncbi:hypothetical protein C8J56DRAFT_970759 [Mycena floridula]|nr:hypothetical protein C8J56DRAFT_970759 [Mycena floridula]